MLKHRVKSGGYYCQNCQFKAMPLCVEFGRRSEWQVRVDVGTRIGEQTKCDYSGARCHRPTLRVEPKKKLVSAGAPSELLRWTHIAGKLL